MVSLYPYRPAERAVGICAYLSRATLYRLIDTAGERAAKSFC
jgi:hypothetical protein